MLSSGPSPAGPSIGSILLDVEITPGIYIDLRFAPLALAGMLGGALPAAIAAVLAVGFRIWLGGAAVVDASASGRVLQAEPGRVLSQADAALYDAKVQGRNRMLVRTVGGGTEVTKKAG